MLQEEGFFFFIYVFIWLLSLNFVTKPFHFILALTIIAKFLILFTEIFFFFTETLFSNW